VVLAEEIVVKPSPTTVWNILDYFLIDLAMGRVCERPSLSKPLYLGLVDLVCRGDTRVLAAWALGSPTTHSY